MTPGREADDMKRGFLARPTVRRWLELCSNLTLFTVAVGAAAMGTFQIQVAVVGAGPSLAPVWISLALVASVSAFAALLFGHRAPGWLILVPGVATMLFAMGRACNLILARPESLIPSERGRLMFAVWFTLGAFATLLWAGVVIPTYLAQRGQRASARSGDG